MQINSTGQRPSQADGGLPPSAPNKLQNLPTDVLWGMLNYLPAKDVVEVTQALAYRRDAAQSTFQPLPEHNAATCALQIEQAPDLPHALQAFENGYKSVDPWCQRRVLWALLHQALRADAGTHGESIAQARRLLEHHAGARKDAGILEATRLLRPGFLDELRDANTVEEFKQLLDVEALPLALRPRILEPAWNALLEIGSRMIREDPRADVSPLDKITQTLLNSRRPQVVIDVVDRLGDKLLYGRRVSPGLVRQILQRWQPATPGKPYEYPHDRNRLAVLRTYISGLKPQEKLAEYERLLAALTSASPPFTLTELAFVLAQLPPGQIAAQFPRLLDSAAALQSQAERKKIQRRLGGDDIFSAMPEQDRPAALVRLVNAMDSIELKRESVWRFDESLIPLMPESCRGNLQTQLRDLQAELGPPRRRR